MSSKVKIVNTKITQYMVHTIFGGDHLTKGASYANPQCLPFSIPSNWSHSYKISANGNMYATIQEKSKQLLNECLTNGTMTVKST